MTTLDRYPPSTTLASRTPSGAPRRIEIVLHSFDGRLYISGIPNPDRERAWLLNLRDEQRLTLHLKQLIQADVPASAREITDDAERRRVLEKIARVWRRELEPMVAHSPLIEVTPSLPASDPLTSA